MGSSYSNLHNYKQELQTPNFQLIANALQFKQGRLDAGREKLQSVADRLAIVDVAKDVDKDYLRNRLESSMDIVDKYSAMDLSNQSFANELTGKLTEVVDENVMNAIISANTRQAENAEWAKAEDANDGSYNDVNRGHSSQNFNAYYEDQTVGKLYKGGGGFNPFIDVQAKIHKGMPDLAKSMKAEYVEIAGGGSYFRDVVTGNRVPSWKVNEAIDSMLNSQDKKQLNINAWGQYDRMSDEQLGSIYADNYAPRIAQLDSEITSLTATISGTSDKKLASQRQQRLDQMVAMRDGYENNGYENVLKKGGKSAAYNTLYMDQFKSPFLNIYSQDNVTKRETYDNDVKTRSHELALKKFDLSVRKQEFTEAKALAEFESKGGNRTTNDPNYVAPIRGDKVKVEYTDEMETLLSQLHEKDKQVIGDIKNTFGITTNAQLRDFKKEVIDKGYIGKEEVTFNGKKHKVSEVLGMLRLYENEIINKSPGEKKAFEALNSAVDKSLWTLKKVAQGEKGDIDFYNSTPKFNFKFVKLEDGTFKKTLIDGTNNNNYSRLLKKETLTEAENITLKTYHRMHMLGDPEIASGVKDVLFEDMQDNLFKSITNEDFESFPRDKYSYTRILKGASSSGFGQLRTTGITDGMQESDFFNKYKDHFTNVDGALIYTQDYEEYDNLLGKINTAYGSLGKANGEGERKEIQSKINGYQATLDRELSLVSKRGMTSDSQDYYLSELDSGDTEYNKTDREGNKSEVSLRGIDNILETGIDAYMGVMEQELKKGFSGITEYGQVFTEGSAHEKLIGMVDLKKGDKTPITLSRVIDEDTGLPSGVVEYSYPYTVTKDGERKTKYEMGTLEQETLQMEGVIDYKKINNTYDASMGDNSYVIDLGTNTYDEALNIKSSRLYGENLAMSNTNLITTINQAYETSPALVPVVRKMAKDFDNGSYKFKMESIGGAWHNTIYRDGERLGAYLTEENPIVEYQPSDIDTMQQDSRKIVNKVMSRYIKEFINAEIVEQGMQHAKDLRTKIIG